MLNFIVCDDNKVVNKAVVDIINKIMMGNKLNYKVHSFLDYDSKFMKILDSKVSNKIYVLDIETPTSSGIDIARQIRGDDINSVIIFLTSHDELGYTILKSEFMVLTFISKFDDYLNKIESALTKAVTISGEKCIVRFSDHGYVYTIPTDDILYITRDSIERKLVIKTDYSEFLVSKTMSELRELLCDDFLQTHRACIVNRKRVVKMSYSKKYIMFDTNEKINLITPNYKEEVNI